MTTEWNEVTDPKLLFSLDPKEWEIEVRRLGDTDYKAWDGVGWGSPWSFRARPRPLAEDLKQRLREYDFTTSIAITDEAADRIERLEAEVAGWKASAENRLEIQRQREEQLAAAQARETELMAHAERLREALESARTMIGHPDNIAIIDAALAKVRKP